MGPEGYACQMLDKLWVKLRKTGALGQWDGVAEGPKGLPHDKKELERERTDSRNTEGVKRALCPGELGISL